MCIFLSVCFQYQVVQIRDISMCHQSRSVYTATFETVLFWFNCQGRLNNFQMYRGYWRYRGENRNIEIACMVLHPKPIRFFLFRHIQFYRLRMITECNTKMNRACVHVSMLCVFVSPFQFLCLHLLLHLSQDFFFNFADDLKMCNFLW